MKKLRSCLRSAFAVGCVLVATPTFAQSTGRPPVMNWSGFYVGAYVGGGFGSSPWSNPDLGDLGTTNFSGPIVSLQGGYNWQFNNNMIAGIDVSGGISNIRGDFETLGWNFGAQVRGLESIAGRLGVATGPGNDTLLFVRAGLAFGQYRLTSNWPEIDTQFRSDKSVTGGTVGVGVEYALNSNWSAKAAYDYYDFGSRRVDLMPNTDLVPPFPVYVRSWGGNYISVGFNYRR